MKSILFVITCLLQFVSTAQVSAQHAGDIFLAVDGGTIYTGQIDAQQNITWPVRVFAATFGDSGCPPFTATPGFDCLPGTFPVGSRTGWNAVDGLKVWNGSGFDLVDTETLKLSFQSVSFTVGTSPVAGFSLFVQADGGFHRHLDFCMNGCPNGCSLPPNADNGIYLLNLEVFSNASLQTSDPFWLVFNYNDSTANQQAAIEWVQNNLLGDPCRADLVGDDDNVNVSDLFALLANWNTSGPGAGLAPPTNVVDVADLFALLAAWGTCDP